MEFKLNFPDLCLCLLLFFLKNWALVLLVYQNDTMLLHFKLS